MGECRDIVDWMWQTDHGTAHGVMLRAAIEIPMLWAEIRPIFHKRLAKLIEERGTTKRALSLAIGQNEYYISKLITADSAPGFDKILAISDALSVHYTALFEADMGRVVSLSSEHDDKAFEELLFSLTRYTNAVTMIQNKEIGPQEIIAKWREKKGETSKLVDIIEHLDVFEIINEHPFLRLERIGEQSLASQVLNGPKFMEYSKELDGPLIDKITESLPRYQSVIDDDDVIFTSEIIRTNLLSGRTLVLKYECYLMPGRENGKPTRVLTFADPTEVSLVKSERVET